ncbi:MAG: hypothetical protein QM538_03930 [Methylacidiphilales bacterium]|nr:hypothetical protein [Candidatus Methylacidiphilales bacterium]
MNEHDLDKLLNLSKLAITLEERKLMIRHFELLLEHLQTIAGEHVTHTNHSVSTPISKEQLRPDVVTHLPISQITTLTHLHNHKFTVPRVIDE